VSTLSVQAIGDSDPGEADTEYLCQMGVQVWVSYTQSGPTTDLASSNVSSIDDDATGQFEVHLSASFNSVPEKFESLQAFNSAGTGRWWSNLALPLAGASEFHTGSGVPAKVDSINRVIMYGIMA